MKRQLSVITVIWLMALIIIINISTNNSHTIDGIYKVIINRIHPLLTQDLEKNIKIINKLTEEEMELVEDIEIIDYQHKSHDEVGRFFYSEISSGDRAIFKPIEGTKYIVKYKVKSSDSKGNTKVLVILLITGGYIYLVLHILILNRKLIRPLIRISGITKELAKGYLGKINLQSKNKYFKDFIWGLDMLREQLSYERDRNLKLEKERKTLVAGLSHDIKTPLSSVKNYAIALKENIYEGKEERNSALEIILDKVEVIEKLTKELLDTSSKEMRSIEVKPKEIYMIDVHNQLDRIIHQKTDLLHMDYIEAKLHENLMVMVDLERLQ